MARFISRDPFAREELWRESVRTYGYCKWCGGTNCHASKDGMNLLYQYYIESDNMRRSNITGLFCCVDCMRSYHS